jgi:hypothetical protein
LLAPDGALFIKTDDGLVDARTGKPASAEGSNRGG